MTTHTICNDGNTFADLSGDFPTVETFRADNPYAWSNVHAAWWDLPGDFLSWFVVLHDPRSLTYFDEDRRAMDETNHDVCVEVLPDDVPDLYSRRLPVLATETAAAVVERSWREDEETARECGAAWFGRVLLVAPDSAEILDHVRECARSLADYPLLDESAYSSREWDAWQDYAPTALGDEIRWPDEEDRDRMVSLVGEDWTDVLDYAADDLLPVVCGLLHYTGGFSGEYGPSMLSLVADLVETDSAKEWTGRSADEVREILSRARTEWESVEPATV